MTDTHVLLAGGKEIPFSDLETALGGVRESEVRRKLPRASTGTLVALGTPAQLAPTVTALADVGTTAGVRAILIAEGTQARPVVRMTESLIAIDGLAPRYLNNAVAAVRLPSLPALIWWRGGSEQALQDVTALADRLVLDTRDPDHVWERAAAFLEQTALTDLRWTRLTRWRSVVAHLFDLPQVRHATPTFRRLVIEAGDRSAARLFAAWLVSCLRCEGMQIQIGTVTGDGRSVLESVQLTGDRISIAVHRMRGSDCLKAAVDGDVVEDRVAPLGETTLAACMYQELAVRSRDLAFERALARLGAVPA